MSSINTLHKIKLYGITAKKQFGQNFIFDENILSKIVQKSMRKASWTRWSKLKPT